MGVTSTAVCSPVKMPYHEACNVLGLMPPSCFLWDIWKRLADTFFAFAYIISQPGDTYQGALTF